jgi:NAD(P)-dependent dehydrogenase (short-subunit alcohol dehydrogenase family)
MGLGAPDAVGISTDVGSDEQITAAFAQISERWGSLNALINTVGPFAGTFDELSDADWESAFNLGTMSAVRCVRAALPLLRAADWARIVNFAAHSVRRQSGRLVAYTASKAALTSVSKNLARTLGADGILVNTISPGTIVTGSFTGTLRPILAAEGLDAADPHDVMTWVARTFGHPADLGRAGLPEEVASITVYLASRANGYVTGANVNVDGGSDFC